MMCLSTSFTEAFSDSGLRISAVEAFMRSAIDKSATSLYYAGCDKGARKEDIFTTTVRSVQEFTVEAKTVPGTRISPRKLFHGLVKS